MEIYFWIRFSGLAGKVDVEGLDKVFPESRKRGDGATKMTESGRMGQIFTTEGTEVHGVGLW